LIFTTVPPPLHKGHTNGIIFGCAIKGNWLCGQELSSESVLLSFFKVSCFAMWKTQNVNGRQNITYKNTVILRSHQGR